MVACRYSECGKIGRGTDNRSTPTLRNDTLRIAMKKKLIVQKYCYTSIGLLCVLEVQILLFGEEIEPLYGKLSLVIQFKNGHD